jgi:hypothetical protein
MEVEAFLQGYGDGPGGAGEVEVRAAGRDVDWDMG